MDYVTLTSSNIASAFIGALDDSSRQHIVDGRMKLVSISPVTSAAIRQLGLPVAAEATRFTTEGIVEAVVKLARKATDCS
jgi:uroporphyrinogen III methyltransferase/synthase